MLPNDSLGSKAVRLRMSTCFPVCARKRTYLPILELLPPPALRERRHRGLARRLVDVRWRAVLVVPEGEGPPSRSLIFRVGSLPRRHSLRVIAASFVRFSRPAA